MDVVALLNELLEAERAGARLLADWMSEAPPVSPLRERLQAVQRDEAENCAILIHLLRDARATPSGATGAFYGKALAIKDWRERLDFLNRGQGWVAKRIAAALPQMADSPARTALQECTGRISPTSRCATRCRSRRRPRRSPCG